MRPALAHLGIMTAILTLSGLAAAQTAATAAAQDATEAREAAAERLGVELESDAPMSISSDALEAVRDESGAEKIVFTHNVVVEQGSLRIYCDRLEALYPQGESGGRPDRITASGSVRITQPGREAHCAVATVDNRAGTALCVAKSGKVELRRGGDVIRADSVEFNLATGAVKAQGGVTIRVQPEVAAE